MRRLFVAENQFGIKIWAKDLAGPTCVDWYCPGCKGRVQLKKGKLIAAHFAHVALEDCQSFSEGETTEHLSGKLLLHQWAPNSELEAYLPELKQRPDVLWGNIAFEFQCSSLSFERFLERTEIYVSHRYYPWWLLGQQFHPKKRLSQFQKACCYYDQKLGVKLWLLSENDQEIRLCYQFQWHYQNGYNYEIQVFNYRRDSLRAILSNKIMDKQSNREWDIFAFQGVLKRKLCQREAKILAAQEKLYLQGGHLLHLPQWCYEDSRYFFFFEEELLYLRWLYLKSSTYNQWLFLIEKDYFNWFFPLIPKEKILQAIYFECRILASSKKIRESK